ncbi:5-(carboxyamino)imidazole ribonucleotide synthase [Haloactinopolyspora sp.]|uniref:5-(carboxyamino)imidazole ribonucleotide synthase n=1 Tax=Haloactinopolyspora sp. TaxID=1966353 RepID=UPI0026289E5A|nr:5-(carboxyamino)imidazole ribonucleotide synthase [Haloactinopolyspora sp.]
MGDEATWPVVGMVGGGQLARMSQPPAVALGVRLSVLAASPEAAAAQVINSPVVADEKAMADLRAFAESCDVLTFDHEHVPSQHLQELEALGVPVRPGSAALVHAQDKLVMRERLTALGVPCPRYRVVTGPDEVRASLRDLGDSVVLKTSRGGYDGKGVWLIDGGTSAEVIAEPFRAGVPVLVEERVNFTRELAAVVARSPSGQAVAYPVVESVQRDGICVEVVAPAPGLDPDLAAEAQRTALSVAAELDVVGVLAVELFQTADDRLLVNELAMRPHNSAHWTIDGAVTSQFENHLRAVLDLPLGSPMARAPYTVMVNVLGGDLPDVYPAYRHVLARDPGLKVHWYGKAVTPGRKVGHVTVYGDDLDDLRERAWHAADYIRGDIDE